MKTLYLEQKIINNNLKQNIMEKFNVVNGTSYHKDTSIEVIKVLELISRDNLRVKLHYGDTKTGVDWNDEYDVTGYIGRSTGSIKIPLLIHNKSSISGGGILDHCLIKIKLSKGGKVLYKSSNYQERTIEIVEGDMEDRPFNTTIDGKLYGRHTSKKSAERVKALLT